MASLTRGTWAPRIARLQRIEDRGLPGLMIRSVRSYGSHACGIFAAAIATSSRFERPSGQMPSCRAARL